jgi:hypothetical protein
VSRNDAKAFYNPAAGENSTAYITPTDAKSAIDTIYDDMAVADADIISLLGDPQNPALYLPKAGGTLTGPIVLSADPNAAMHPATKQYVDALAARAVAGRTTVTLSFNAGYSDVPTVTIPAGRLVPGLVVAVASAQEAHTGKAYMITIRNATTSSLEMRAYDVTAPTSASGSRTLTIHWVCRVA